MAAAVDGELSPRRRRALDRHLAGCASCRQELVSTELMLGAVATLPAEAEVPARLEQATLRRVRLLAAEEAETRPGWWKVVRLPAFVITSMAVLALAVGIVLENGTPGRHAGGRPAPDEVASAPAEAPAVATAEQAPVGAPLKEPPAELAARPDLFVEMPILRNLEKLQNFEAIQMTTLDDAPTPGADGAEGSNG
jgi:anti-sigma factor RsiW